MLFVTKACLMTCQPAKQKNYHLSVLSGEKGLGFGMEAGMRDNQLDNSAEWPVLIEKGGK